MKGFKSKPKITFTVHGENPGMHQYAQDIRNTLQWNVIEPKYLETVNLFHGI